MNGHPTKKTELVLIARDGCHASIKHSRISLFFLGLFNNQTKSLQFFNSSTYQPSARQLIIVSIPFLSLVQSTNSPFRLADPECLQSPPPSRPSRPIASASTAMTARLANGTKSAMPPQLSTAVASPSWASTPPTPTSAPGPSATTRSKSADRGPSLW